ncbi:MAG: sigma-70 family RNA polymerase sigma factor [Pirellulales bacterium]|nr:sigma-70 family RNA polymerase sigma factor [Pirellulales bacterium]
MAETSLSLLDRLHTGTDSNSWQQLAQIYTPLLQSWLRRYGLESNDADDIIQEVLVVVFKELPLFQHSGRQGAFRSWLRTILANRLRNYWRARQKHPIARGSSHFLEELNQLEDPDSGLSQIWEKQHDEHVLRQLLKLIEPRFESRTWRAFQRLVFDGRPPDAVAAELDMSVNAVFIAKSRILSQLRQEGRGLVG